MCRMMENWPGGANERYLAQSSPFASWPYSFQGKKFVVPVQAMYKVSLATLSSGEVKLVIPSLKYKTLATTNILYIR